MRGKLAGAALAALALLACAFALALASVQAHDPETAARGEVVALNEVYHLQEAAASGDAQAQADLERRQDELRERLVEQAHSGDRAAHELAIALFAVCAAFVIAVALYAYARIVRPFERLQAFAADVAKGDLESALPRERHNLFGDFTWAFDRMRSEVSRARAAEAAAIDANKTVIASFSHDIKTPAASIRAYAEALEMGLDSTPEERRRYASMIMAKCDELSAMTDDLFLHAVSDLDKLEVACAPNDARVLVEGAIAAASAEGVRLALAGEVPEATVLADPRRFGQALGNVVANARKYAPGSPVRVTCALGGETLAVRFEDAGPGVAPEDLPFLFDKFYRGANAGEEAGAGLGLAIVAHLMERMGGRATAENTADGFAVTLWLARVEDATSPTP